MSEPHLLRTEADGVLEIVFNRPDKFNAISFEMYDGLTQAAIDESGARGVRSIDLTSRPSRVAANAMYVKMGFVARETNVYRFTLDG